MIIFKSIKWKNFLSTGNNFTKIDLNRNKKTLIMGTNGAGKSTLLDALSFALFGKAYRNINKPQLINTINNKDCEVEVEFQIGRKKYRVRRGIKPGIFEIYLNDKLVNQSSHNKDYQKILEQEILKMNHRSFTQIVVLGSSNYTPFMKLPTGARRAVIENFLDIDIFTKMNNILKEKISEKRVQEKDIQYQIDIVTTQLQSMQSNLKTLVESDNNSRNKKKEKIEQLKSKMEKAQEENNKIKEAMLKFREISNKNAENEKLLKRLNDFDKRLSWKLSSVNQILKTVCDNDKCPSCQQQISDELKKLTKDIKDREIGKIKDKKDTITECIDNLNQKISDFKKKAESIDKLSRKLSQNNLIINDSTSEIESYETDEDVLLKEKISDEKKNIKESLNELKKIKRKKDKLEDTKKYDVFLSELLKDSGIKTKIINQYLPIINEKINEYLQILDFYVLFNFDDTFNETLKSRHRDTFAYASFSEGEKQRIDLALLFTWRDVAKLKNSVSTNLLIFDEIFDSSLDTEGVENLEKILNTVDDQTNIFVISHKTDLINSIFDSKIEFTKPNNFSEIK